MSTQHRTITMTGRAPVRISDEEWPVIAEGRDSDHDGQVACQANRTWSVWIRVRQHADGRTLVYGAAEYGTCYQGEHGYTERAGYLVAAGDDVAATISRVGDALAEQAPDQAARIRAVTRDAVADLPAEEL